MPKCGAFYKGAGRVKVGGREATNGASRRREFKRTAKVAFSFYRYLLYESGF